MEKVKELVTKCTYNLDIAVKGIEQAYTNLYCSCYKPLTERNGHLNRLWG